MSSQNSPSFAEDLRLIETVASQAAQLAMPYFTGDTALDVQVKEGNSPVSAADFAVDAYLKEHLLAARPDYGWLSEETVDDNKAHRVAAPRTFVVDPIDGTRGFINGMDMWCVSVGVIENGRPIAGVLVCPARDEVFAASLGGGATLNSKKLQVKQADGAELVIGGPRVFLDAFDGVTDAEISRYPHVPSLAYRIALVACGRMNATFIKPNAHDWDVAAADIILHEAGGVLLGSEGEKLQLNTVEAKKPVMVASTPNVADQMLAIVRSTPFS